MPLIVGHRGASGYRPEHTFGSYQLALDMGADVIEQDLVPTKDGHLVCRHENDITATTDVSAHPEFADRKTTKSVDGVKLTGWFTEDFTLAELKTLRAKERIPGTRQHNTLYDGRVGGAHLRGGAPVGRARGPQAGPPRLAAHRDQAPHLLPQAGPRAGGAAGQGAAGARPAPQELPELPAVLRAQQHPAPGQARRTAPRSSCSPRSQHRPWDFVEAGDPRTVADLVKPEGLKWLAGFAQGIGPDLTVIIPRDKDGKLGEPTSVVKDAHAAGLVLHPYTVRNENTFLPADYRRGTDPNAYGDALGVFKAYLATGIDGLFSDNPDTALLAAAEFRKR